MMPSDPPTAVAESDPPTSLVPRGSFRELLPGTVVDDTYEVDAKLGAGAMGEVYAARHIKLGKRVAIKVISRRLSEDDAAIERFAMEARTLARIQHPAIVAVEHVGELTDGRAYFIMEFLRGETLFDRISRGRVPIAEALRIFDQLARGLDAAHGEGIVHRDVKPENTFLVHLPGEPPLVKIVDFGLSTLRALDQRTERTQSGVAIGTPLYMSPEQMRGPDVDYRTDIYALGCVAYELLLGQPLFPRAQTAPELYAAHLHEVPPPPRSIWSGIPPQLDLVLFAMVAKDPARRPTLEQVRAVAAVAAAEHEGNRAATMIVGEPPQGHPRRKWTAAIAVITLVGGIAIGVAVTGGGAKDAPSPAAPKIQIQTRPQPPQGTLTVSPIVPPTPTRITVTATATSAPPHHEIPARNIPRPPSSDRPTVKHADSNVGSAVPVTAPSPPVLVDAGVIIETPAPPQPPQRPKPPPPVVDRNQTINPFKHKVHP